MKNRVIKKIYIISTTFRPSNKVKNKVKNKNKRHEKKNRKTKQIIKQEGARKNCK